MWQIPLPVPKPGFVACFHPSIFDYFEGYHPIYLLLNLHSPFCGSRAQCEARQSNPLPRWAWLQSQSLVTLSLDCLLQKVFFSPELLFILILYQNQFDLGVPAWGKLLLTRYFLGSLQHTNPTTRWRFTEGSVRGFFLLKGSSYPQGSLHRPDENQFKRPCVGYLLNQNAIPSKF